MNPDEQTLKVDTTSTVNSNASFDQAFLDYVPVSGFINSLAGVPSIEDSDIYHYFLIKCHGTQSTAQKHRDKSWIFYKTDNVICLEFILEIDEEVMTVRGDVVASLRIPNVGQSIKLPGTHMLRQTFRFYLGRQVLM